MHVKSISQIKFSMSLGTHRNKPRSKPWLEPPPTTLLVSLSADERTIRNVRSDSPRVVASNTEHLPKNTSQEFVWRTVRSSIRNSTQNRVVFGTHPELVRRTVRPSGPDSPQVKYRYRLAGLCIACILHNSYKTEQVLSSLSLIHHHKFSYALVE